MLMHGPMSGDGQPEAQKQIDEPLTEERSTRFNKHRPPKTPSRILNPLDYIKRGPDGHLQGICEIHLED